MAAYCEGEAGMDSEDASSPGQESVDGCNEYIADSFLVTETSLDEAAPERPPASLMYTQDNDSVTMSAAVRCIRQPGAGTGRHRDGASTQSTTTNPDMASAFGAVRINGAVSATGTANAAAPRRMNAIFHDDEDDEDIVVPLGKRRRTDITGAAAPKAAVKTPCIMAPEHISNSKPPRTAPAAAKPAKPPTAPAAAAKPLTAVRSINDVLGRGGKTVFTPARPVPASLTQPVPPTRAINFQLVFNDLGALRSGLGAMQACKLNLTRWNIVCTPQWRGVRIMSYSSMMTQFQVVWLECAVRGSSDEDDVLTGGDKEVAATDTALAGLAIVLDAKILSELITVLINMRGGKGEEVALVVTQYADTTEGADRLYLRLHIHDTRHEDGLDSEFFCYLRTDSLLPNLDVMFDTPFRLPLDMRMLGMLCTTAEHMGVQSIKFNVRALRVADATLTHVRVAASLLHKAGAQGGGAIQWEASFHMDGDGTLEVLQDVVPPPSTDPGWRTVCDSAFPASLLAPLAKTFARVTAVLCLTDHKDSCIPLVLRLPLCVSGDMRAGRLIATVSASGEEE